MKKQALESLIAILAALLFAAAVAWAGSQDGVRIAGLPVFALAGIVAFVIQWAVFVPSFRAQTERWYDLTGSLTYLTVTIGALLLAGRFDLRSLVIVALISPVFVYLLLTRISGLPMLESRAEERWGDDPTYRDYKARTPVLFPRPPR